MKTVDSKVTADEVKDAVALLLRITTEDQPKLRWGHQKREALQQDLANERPLRGYRAEFLYLATAAVIKALTKEAEKFNRLYKHDKISVLDYLDVLKSAHKKVRLTASKGSATTS